MWIGLQVQMGLLFLLIGSQIDFVVGTFIGPQKLEHRAQGFVGLNCKSGELIYGKYLCESLFEAQ